MLPDLVQYSPRLLVRSVSAVLICYLYTLMFLQNVLPTALSVCFLSFAGVFRVCLVGVVSCDIAEVLLLCDVIVCLLCMRGKGVENIHISCVFATKRGAS